MHSTRGLPWCMWATQCQSAAESSTLVVPSSSPPVLRTGAWAGGHSWIEPFAELQAPLTKCRSPMHSTRGLPWCMWATQCQSAAQSSTLVVPSSSPQVLRTGAWRSQLNWAICRASSTTNQVQEPNAFDEGHIMYLALDLLRAYRTKGWSSKFFLVLFNSSCSCIL